MEVKIFKSGLLQTNTYLVIKENNCIVIDPAFAYDKITHYIDKHKLRLLGVLLTHGHFDHIADASEIAARYNCKIYMSKKDLDMVFDSRLNGSKKYLRKDITIPKNQIGKRSSCQVFICRTLTLLLIFLLYSSPLLFFRSVLPSIHARVRRQSTF